MPTAKSIRASLTGANTSYNNFKPLQTVAKNCFKILNIAKIPLNIFEKPVEDFIPSFKPSVNFFK